jgi:hypothetical protein
MRARCAYHLFHLTVNRGTGIEAKAAGNSYPRDLKLPRPSSTLPISIRGHVPAIDCNRAFYDLRADNTH